MFCTECIETWLLKKRNNCPFCRYEVNLKEYDEGKSKVKNWNFVDFDKTEYEYLSNQMFEECLKKIIS